MSDADEELIRNGLEDFEDGGVFDERDPLQHTEKLLFLIGVYYALHRNKEYANLTKSNIFQ